MARLEALALHREAVRRALSLLAQPFNMPLAARLLYETVDAIWYAVGDASADFSFYTKRGTLAGVLAVTTLYWLEDRSANFVETRGFLERRLARSAPCPGGASGFRHGSTSCLIRSAWPARRGR